MAVAIYNPNGGPITAKAVFTRKETMVANYRIMLRQKDSNATTTLLEGDNLNEEDDVTGLPLPADSNEGRRVILETGFKGAAGSAYHIKLEIWQDGAEIGSDLEQDTLNGSGQYSLLFVKLQRAVV